MFDILFVGTGASIPSRDKNLPCVAVRQGRHITMFDCGEGSQKQLLGSQFSVMKIENIFITHIHGDHILGVPGLMQTMSMLGRKDPISIYGPPGTKTSVSHLLNACNEESSFKINVTEVEPGNEFNLGYASVTAVETEHSIPSVGYVYREPDSQGVFDLKKALSFGLNPGPDFTKIQKGEIVNGISSSQIIGPPKKGSSMMYTGDTRICNSVLKAAKGVSVLIHEATYTNEDSELAKKNFHSTAKDAAEVARSCGSRMLALVHISNRYKTKEQSLHEAKMLFDNTIAPSDLDMVTVLQNAIKLS